MTERFIFAPDHSSPNTYLVAFRNRVSAYAPTLTHTLQLRSTSISSRGIFMGEGQVTSEAEVNLVVVSVIIRYAVSSTCSLAS